ncbi:class I SAM-dependent methyltransferase [Nocardia farcinica]|uniref:class I SAM-dependent methyltransferase n=1 Tax=Nocardia farcinica TaxID=37329 RepID=UPI001895685A|nr:methyltransferase domain-containing protein [Nocardia farcinica]MBF6386782.1 methyltransferase domain-containing protein [Nocardia farcinica]
MASLVTKVLGTVAGQLGNPHGVLGKGVALMLNRTNRAMIAAAVDAAEPGPGDIAADVGFGGGVGLSMLLDRVGPDGSVVGVELSPDMLSRARSGYAREIAADRLTLREGSLTELPQPDRSLDALITVNTLYFVPELDRACAELARVLRPGGRAVVAVGDPTDMAKLPFTEHGFRLRPVAELRAALTAAGLKVEHIGRPRKPVGLHLLVGRRP